jgi:iron complex transport system substrate-binding protein
VPSATETLFALGAGDEVIAVTHECDWPPDAAERDRVTRDLIEPGRSPGEIERAVRERTERGESIYALDVERLVELQPDLIVTQALCTVCAVSYDDVRAIAQERIPGPPQVLSLDPGTMGEVLEDVRRLAEAIDRWSEGEALLEDAAERIDVVRDAVDGAWRPRVAAIEWLDPPFVAGHWTPQLVDWAGGEDVLGFAGEHSFATNWENVAAARPEVVVVMPCGYDAARAHREAETFRDRLEGVGAGQVVAVDASAYFSRPGPRLVEGLELLAYLLHPDRFPEPPPAIEQRALELA